VFGTMLRHYRTLAGLTQTELGALVHITGDMISKIEQGDRAATADLTTRLDAASELDTRGALTPLHEELGDGLYSAGFPTWYLDFAVRQAEAVNLRLYELHVVPGLLQTEDYARAIFGTRFKVTEAEIDELVAARMMRQEILARERPPGLWVILEESVLRRPVGGRQVMLVQVGRLIEAARRPNIVIQVIPMSVGAHEGLAGSFVIADFDGAPSVGYVETAVHGQPVDSAKDVAALELTWDTLRAEALPRSASLALLEEAAKSWTSAA
jgi:transcriptional regulator with XRE-family HTH domain